jgi:hypothetical protein
MEDREIIKGVYSRLSIEFMSFAHLVSVLAEINRIIKKNMIEIKRENITSRQVDVELQNLLKKVSQAAITDFGVSIYENVRITEIEATALAPLTYESTDVPRRTRLQGVPGIKVLSLMDKWPADPMLDIEARIVPLSILIRELFDRLAFVSKLPPTEAALHTDAITRFFAHQ